MPPEVPKAFLEHRKNEKRVTSSTSRKIGRTFELTEDLDEGKARDGLMLLADRYPTGSPADFEGASSRLVNDLIREGKLEDEDIAELMRISFESGGLSVG